MARSNKTNVEVELTNNTPGSKDVQLEVEQSSHLPRQKNQNEGPKESTLSDDIHHEETNNNLISDRQSKVIKPPQIYGQANLVAVALIFAEEIIYLKPINYREALTNKEVDKWLIAMQEEIECLNKNKTWKWVQKPIKAKVSRIKMDL